MKVTPKVARVALPEEEDPSNHWHGNRFRRHSDAYWEKLFWHRVIKEDGCWGWKGPILPNGYASSAWMGRSEGAHRISYRIHRGDIPKGVVICHKCDNPPCCNPDHLFAGTDGDNVRDCHAKGRNRNGSTKLTPSIVMEIRRLAFDGYLKQSDIGHLFGAEQATISGIVRGDTWRKLPVLGTPKPKSRWFNGESNGNSKLDHSKAKRIREIYAAGGISRKGIGKLFGVGSSIVGDILRGKRWRTVDSPH